MFENNLILLVFETVRILFNAAVGTLHQLWGSFDPTV